MTGAPTRTALETVTPGMVADRSTEVVLIWSNEHRAWWRPRRQGYTTDRASAGRYAFDDAHAVSKHCGPEKGIAFERD